MSPNSITHPYQFLLENYPLETLLAQNSYYFHAILDTIYEAILIYDVDNHKIMNLNSRAEQLFGYSCEIIKQKGIKLLCTERQPYSIDDARRWLEQAEQTQETQVFEWLVLHQRQYEFWVEVRLSFVKIHQYKRAIISVRNITEQKQAEFILRQNEELFHSLFEKHDAVMFLIEPHTGKILQANHAAARFYGYSEAYLCTSRITEFNTLSPEEVQAEMRKATQEERNYFIFPHRLASGEIRTVEVHSSPIKMQGRTLLFSIIHDITERHLAEQQLRESQQHLELALNSADLATWNWDIAQDRVFFDKTWFALLGYTDNALPYHREHWYTFVHPDDQKRVQSALNTHLADSYQPYQIEYRLRHQAGHWLWVLDRGKVTLRDEQQNALQMYGVLSNITERKSMEEELRYLAMTDKLTGLYNRHYFLQCLEQAITQTTMHNYQLSILMFDIDYFKHINDHFGHDIGDFVLQQLAQRVREQLRKTDIFARWGGEEFLILLTNTHLSEAYLIAQRLCETFNRVPLETVGVVTASFGLTCYHPKETISQLLKRLDKLVYAAKAAGRNCVKWL